MVTSVIKRVKRLIYAYLGNKRFSITNYKIKYVIEQLLISNNLHISLCVIESHEGGRNIHVNKKELFRLDLIETYSHEDNICIRVGR